MPEENTGIIIMIYEQKSQNSVLCSARRGLARLQRVGLVRERVERVAPVGLCLLHPAQHLLLLPAQLAEALLSSSRLDSATCAFSSASSFSFCLVDRKLALSRLVFLCSLPIGTVMMASRLPVRARGVWFEKYQSKELAESIPGFLVPHGFVRAVQRTLSWGDGAHLGGASDLSGRRPSWSLRAGRRSHACRAPSAPSLRIRPSSSPGRRAFCSEFALHYMGLRVYHSQCMYWRPDSNFSRRPGRAGFRLLPG